MEPAFFSDGSMSVTFLLDESHMIVLHAAKIHQIHSKACFRSDSRSSQDLLVHLDFNELLSSNVHEQARVISHP